MWARRTRGTVFIAALSLLVLVLAACAPAEEPAADDAPADDEPAAEAPQEEEVPEEEAADAEPATDDATADDDGADDAAGEEPAPDPGDLEVTAYVVAYHWGFAIFDEDGSELEQLEVAEGATVELVAVNDHASEAIAQLPDPVTDAIASADWHERAHHDVEMGRIPDPEGEIGEDLGEALSAAHDGHDHMGPVQDHTLMVTGVGERAFLDSHAHEPARLEFTADEEGTYEFRCTEECGFGHRYQRWEMLTVEA